MEKPCKYRKKLEVIREAFRNSKTATGQRAFSMAQEALEEGAEDGRAVKSEVKGAEHGNTV